MDSIQSRGILHLLQDCTNLEIESFCETWAFFEQIHSRSYTHIIKNIYPNPSASSFKVNYFSSSNEDVKVTSYDLTGRMIQSLTVKYESINDQEIGNDYTPGVYVVVLNQGKISKSVRVIKN